MRRVGIGVARVVASQWGEVGAQLLDYHWLGRVWDVDGERLILVGDPVAGEVVRLVGPGDYVAPFDLMVEPSGDLEFRAWARPGAPAWRVGRELWIGDSLTVTLPTAPPASSVLNWSELRLDETTLHRRLAWLSDFVLARAPEGTLAGLLPELLAGRELRDRADLNPRERLFHWRAGRVLRALLPALARGDLATAERVANRLAGLGPGIPAAGDYCILGLMAGIRLWPPFLEPSGLNQETILKRLARTAAERTGVAGGALLRHGAEHRYGAHWHELARTLQHENACSDKRRQALDTLAQYWLAQLGTFGSNALAGLLLPFLWHQRRAGEV